MIPLLLCQCHQSAKAVAGGILAECGVFFCTVVEKEHMLFCVVKFQQQINYFKVGNGNAALLVTKRVPSMRHNFKGGILLPKKGAQNASHSTKVLKDIVCHYLMPLSELLRGITFGY